MLELEVMVSQVVDVQHVAGQLGEHVAAAADAEAKSILLHYD